MRPARDLLCSELLCSELHTLKIGSRIEKGENYWYPPALTCSGAKRSACHKRTRRTHLTRALHNSSQLHARDILQQPIPSYRTSSSTAVTCAEDGGSMSSTKRCETRRSTLRSVSHPRLASMLTISTSKKKASQPKLPRTTYCQATQVQGTKY